MMFEYYRCRGKETIVSHAKKLWLCDYVPYNMTYMLVGILHKGLTFVEYKPKVIAYVFRPKRVTIYVPNDAVLIKN